MLAAFGDPRLFSWQERNMRQYRQAFGGVLLIAALFVAVVGQRCPAEAPAVPNESQLIELLRSGAPEAKAIA